MTSMSRKTANWIMYARPFGRRVNPICGYAFMLALVHYALAIGWATGVTFSRNNLPSGGKEPFVHSVWIPISHILAGTLLLMAIWWRQHKSWTSLVSTATFGGYTVALLASAVQRHASLTSTIETAGYTAIAFVLAVTWGALDDEDD